MRYFSSFFGRDFLTERLTEADWYLINNFFLASTLELQVSRDRHCYDNWAHRRASYCNGRLFARYDVKNGEKSREWRCYYEEALTWDRKHYDTTKKSPCFHTKSGLELFTNEGEFGNRREWSRLVSCFPFSVLHSSLSLLFILFILRSLFDFPGHTHIHHCCLYCSACRGYLHSKRRQKRSKHSLPFLHQGERSGILFSSQGT